MNIALGILIGLTVLVVWYALYVWCYQGLCKAIKVTRLDNNWGNALLFLFTPIVAYCAIVMLTVTKFLVFITED